MNKRVKAPTAAVWRISENAPMGEWVKPGTKPVAASRSAALPKRPDTRDASPRSSFDLLDGVEVSDAGDTVPDDLFDELFGGGTPSPRT